MDNVLKISEAASMAMHAIAYLAQDPDQQVANKEIAAALRVSEAHLSKVMQRLNKAGMVRSVRGPRGGFVLAKKPEALTLLEVYEAIEGKLPQSRCLLGAPICSGQSCILGDLVNNLNREVKERLEKTRISELTHLFAKEMV